MLTRVPALIVSVLLVGAGLESKALTAAAQVTDLDRMSEAQLLRDLVDEIDDILVGHDPDEIVDEETVGDVMEALRDDGDAGDESEIDFEDLVAEMNEAHTNLQAVVEEALDVEVAGGAGGGVRVAARGAAPPRRKEAPSRVARALVMAIKSQ